MSEDSQTRILGVDGTYVDLAVEVFTLLADPTRVRIILALRDGERSVGRLAELVGRSPTAVSQHLAKLRWGRLVQTRQDGTRMYYRLANEHAVQLVVDAIHQVEHSLDADPAHHRPGRSPRPVAATADERP